MQNDDLIDDGNFTISDFCRWAGISRPYYYVLKKRNEGPRELRIGTKPIISKPDARKWRERLMGE